MKDDSQKPSNDAVVGVAVSERCIADLIWLRSNGTSYTVREKESCTALNSILMLSTLVFFQVLHPSSSNCASCKNVHVLVCSSSFYFLPYYSLQPAYLRGH
jgi:hypothetical protein